MTTKLLNAKEAADFLGVSEAMVRRRKNIPRHKIPGTHLVRYVQEELLEWVRSEAGQEKPELVRTGGGWLTVGVEE